MNKYFKELQDENRISQEPSFEVEGIKFYEFTDEGVNMTQQRFEAFQDVLASYSLFKVKHQDIVDANALILEYCQKGMMKSESNPEVLFSYFEGIKDVVNELKIRMEYNLPVDRTFELATFLYVIEDENPIEYSPEINKKKKEIFKRNHYLFNFFLTKQLPIFADLSRIFQPSFQDIMLTANLKKLTMLQIAAESLFGDGTSNDTHLSTKRQIQELNEYNSLIDYLSQNFTDLSNENLNKKNES